MKWMLRIVVLGVVVAVGLAVAFRNVVLKQKLQEALARQTGFALELDWVDLGLASTSFDLEGLRLLNPPDFPEPQALTINQVRVDYDFWSLFGRELRFREVVVDIPQLVLVRKADGETNAERLGGRGKRAPGEPAPQPDPRETPPAPGEPEEPRGFRIDRLVLRVGTVEFHDYTKLNAEGAPAVSALTLNVDQEHQDVTSLRQLGGLMLGGSIQQMGLFLLGQELQDKDSKLNKKIQKAADKVQQQLNRLFGSPQEK